MPSPARATIAEHPDRGIPVRGEARVPRERARTAEVDAAGDEPWGPQMDEQSLVIREFLAESCENLDQFERDLVAIEQNPRDTETFGRIFRTIHSIKGACGFLAFPRLEAVAHAGEGLLVRLREGEVQWCPEITGALLATADAMRGLLAHIEATGSEGDQAHPALIGRLTRLQETTTGASGDGDLGSGGRLSTDPPATPDPSEVAPAAPGGSGDAAEARDDDSPNPAPAGQDALASSVSHGNIRVDVGLLDKLMNLVGELVLARNQILQHAGSRGDAALLGTSQRLNLITTELQEGVMKTRMQPMGSVWKKLPRVIRDLALTCGKQVRVEAEGSETELDRTIIEAIKDPLTHLVRNAVDHGIEAPEERVRRGKSPAGTLRLRAFHESGQVNIEVTDDGAGIDVERITQRALERGLITREQVARRSDRDLMQLIFVPGFSTAERVTNVSGRGVGMDVVRTNIEKIGGTIEMVTQPGQGTTFKIKIPLTLAIIPALIVTAGRESFAIPQVNLLELVHLEPDQAREGIQTIRGAAILRLRGHLLPLVHLDRMLGLAPAGCAAPERDHRPDAIGTANIVVLQADGRRFGLVVDGINDTEEIVVKPLGKQLKGLSMFAGATIMGDGRLSLILDVSGIAQKAGIASEMAGHRAVEDAAAAGAEAERSAYLLLRNGDDGRVAIPLSHVARLEEIPRSSIESSADREVVQYRDQIIPLVRLGRALNRGRFQGGDDRDPMQVVVYRQRGQSVGLVVDEILDIVEDAVRVRSARAGRGLLGSAVIQQRVTDILDVPGLIHALDPELAAAGLGLGD